MSLLRLFGLILFCLSSAHAYTLDTTSTSTYVKDFGIFVYGDIESIENAFILVQAIATSSELQTIIALFMVFFVPYIGYKVSTTGTFKPFATNLTYVTASILFLSTATVPSASIHIEDLRTETTYAGLPARTYAKVDNIPYPIALVTSTISTITDSLTLLFDNASALIKPDLAGATTSAIGAGNAINDLIKILQFSSFDKVNDQATSMFARSLVAYIEKCGLGHALNNNPDLIVNFKNPKGDIFKYIDPASLNITGSTYTLDFTDATLGTKTYQCDVFWNDNIISQYAIVSTKLQDRISKVTTGDLSSASVIRSYLTIGGDINDTVIANDVGKMQAFMMNAAAFAPVNKAFTNSTFDVSSGQDLANRITAGTSLADLQMQGAGQMKWIAEILPYAYHFMLGIIYSISILVMIVATAMGAEKGFIIWRNFVKGLTTFEFIKISFVIVNASVNQYSAKHAADFISAIGQNPAAVSSIPYYYNYLATMSGVAGTLGAIAIFAIPAMVFSGEVSSALGAVSSIASKYKGNDVRTAQEVTAEQRAKQDAYERELQDQAMLDHLGLSAPAGMGASEFYGLYKKGAEVANASWGAQRMGTGAMADAGVATKGKTMQEISAGQTISSHTTMNDFVQSGKSGGLRHAGGIKGEVAALEQFGDDEVQLSAKVGAFTQAAEGVTLTNARISQGLVNEGGTLTNKGLKSMETRMGAKSAEEGALGDLSATDSARYIAAAGNSAMMKAHQTIGSTEGDMKQYSEEAKKAGKELADVIRDVASTVAEAKTGSTIGGINQVGANAYVQNQITKAGSDSESLDSSINSAGGASKYIATNARKASADMGALQTTMSTTDEKYAGGYEQFVKDSAMVSAEQGIGNIGGLINTPREHRAGFIRAALDKARQDGRYDEVKGDFERAGLVDKDGNANPDNWISGTAFLKANNMNSHNALVAGGMVFSGALGENATVQATSLSSLTTGNKTTEDNQNIKLSGTKINSQNTLASGEVRDTGTKMKAAMTFARTVLGKDAKEENVIDLADKLHDGAEMANFLTGKEGLTQSALAAIKKAGDETGNSEAVNNFINGLSNQEGFTNGEAAAGALTLTALTGYGADRATKALTGKGLWERTKDLLSGEDSKTNKQPVNGSTNNNSDNTSGDPKKNSEHPSSFQKDIKNYTEDYGASKELFDKELRNLENLKDQRERLDEMDPRQASRAHKLDEQILESEKKIAGHAHDMEVANQGIKSTKSSALKGTPSNPFEDVDNPYKTSSSTPIHDEIQLNRKTAGFADEIADLGENLTHGGGRFSKMVGSALIGIGGAMAFSGLFATEAEAKEIPHLPTKPSAGATAVAPVEKGFFDSAMDMFNSITEKGVEIGTAAEMALAGFAMKGSQIAARALPGAAMVVGGLDATNRAMNEDYAGAAMSATAAAVANVPVVGTVASLGIMATQMATDYFGITGTHSSSEATNASASQTIQAMQNDAGLPTAIDAFHTNQNMNTLQAVQPNTISTMQTRGGEMSFMRNSKTGNLDVHLPGQTFAENTGVPFSQFEALSSDPSQAQQFAQMIAKSNFEGQGGGGLASAQDIEQLKTEINSNFNKSFVQNRNLSSNSSMTAMEIENQTELIEDQIASSLSNISETLDEVHQRIGKQ